MALGRRGKSLLAGAAILVLAVGLIGLLNWINTPVAAVGGFDITDIAVDEGGNLYVAEGNEHRIQKVSKTGEVSNFAGTGADGSREPQDYLNVPATRAILRHPSGLAVGHNGTVYMFDHVASKVFKIAQGVISTIPIPERYLGYPNGIAISSNGDLYVHFGSPMQLGKLDSSGRWSVVLEGLKAPNGFPVTFDGMTMDEQDRFWLRDAAPDRISLDGYVDNPFTTTNSNYSLQDSPSSVPPDCQGVSTSIPDKMGGFYFVESCVYVKRMDSRGNVVTVAGSDSLGYSGDGGPALEAKLFRPYLLAVDTFGNLYIADGNHRVRKVDRAGVISTVVG